jgi:hypothetical protein
MMVFEFRVTKYDPAHRDHRGAYSRDDWTSISDIGRSFNGTFLTESEYCRVENGYAAVATAFLREAGIDKLDVVGIENAASVRPQIAEGSSVDLDGVAEVVRCLLREQFWCKLEGPRAFVHVGYDFYMYVGVSRECRDAERLARQLGLFVEPFSSPYRESIGRDQGDSKGRSDD